MALKNILLVDYVVLPCCDLKATRAFYHDIMGFSLMYERSDWVKFQVGTMALALRPQDGFIENRAVHGPAVQLAFRVSYEGVDQCHSELRNRGVNILEEPTNKPWGHRTVFEL